MTLSGINLKRIRDAIDLAMAELHNQIATCPDVVLYATDIDELEAEKAQLQKLAKRMDIAIAKEKL